MPGTIQYKYCEGDEVKSGQVLFILEAMKMNSCQGWKGCKYWNHRNASVIGSELATIE